MMSIVSKSMRVCATAALIFSASAISMVTSLEAQARPSTKSFTCSGAKRFVRNNGAVVMNHKSANLYRRFIANSGFCDDDKSAQPFVVPTKSGSCILRICKQRFRFFNDD